MLKFRNLLAVGLAIVMLMAVMIPLTAAQPAQQGTATPEATTVATSTPEATLTATVEPSPTSAAPAVSPLATPAATAVGTPSILPKTGGENDGAAALGGIVLALGALILLGAFGLALSRRTR